MILASDLRRRAFSHYLRTGMRLRPAPSDALQHKFNPYHDPTNGQFTFGPGRLSLNSGGASPVRQAEGAAQALRTGPAQDLRTGRTLLHDGVYHPDTAPAQVQTIAEPPRPVRPRSNYEAMYDPRTLLDAFPQLRQTRGGAIVALADNLFDFTGPGRAVTEALDEGFKRKLIADIKAVDPGYHHDSLGEVLTAEGRRNEQNDLRFVRAAKYAKVRGDFEPLQLETLKFMQMRADDAYEEGLRRLAAGKMPIRLSKQEALGNFIDRHVRDELRVRYGREEIDSAGSGPVRVNRREANSDDGTYRRPDARVGNIAFDVTLSPKTHKTPQVRGFFNADFRPRTVVIVRPKQLGPFSTYALAREGK